MKGGEADVVRPCSKRKLKGGENMIRGYSKRQFAQSDFDATGYVFPTEEGVFKAVLDCKRYGKTRNLIGYFTLENGQTIMTSAWQNDNYHGLQEVPFGALMELEFVKNKRGVIHLRRATVLG